MVEPDVGDLLEPLELQIGRTALDIERSLQRAGHHVLQGADLAGGFRHHDRRRGQSSDLRQVVRDTGDHDVAQVQPVQVGQPHAELVGGTHRRSVVHREHRLILLQCPGHQRGLPGADHIGPHRVPDQQQHRPQAEPDQHQQQPPREADRGEHPGDRGLGQRHLGNASGRNGRLRHNGNSGQLDGHRDRFAAQQAYRRLAEDPQHTEPDAGPDPAEVVRSARLVAGAGGDQEQQLCPDVDVEQTVLAPDLALHQPGGQQQPDHTERRADDQQHWAVGGQQADDARHQGDVQCVADDQIHQLRLARPDED